MLTLCPKCETVYQIAESQLKARDGLVRCGRCRNVFNAAWNLLDAPPASQVPEAEPEPRAAIDDEQADWIKRLHEELAEEYRPTVTEGERTTPALPAEDKAPAPAATVEDTLPAQDEEPLEEPARGDQWGWGIGATHPASRTVRGHDEPPEPRLAPDTRSVPDPFAGHAPDEEIVLESPVDAEDWHAALEATNAGPAPASGPPAGAGGRRAPAVREVSIPLAHAPRRRDLRKWWIGGTAVLVLLVLLQLFYFFFDRLANVDALRPVLDRICVIFGCELPARQAQGMVDLVESHIAASPQRSEALRVSATLVNRAGFEQGFPDMEVALTNNQGELIARTTFTPEQYLGAGAASTPLMPTNVAIAVRMDVARPLDDAVGYEVALVAAPGAGARPDLAAMGRHVIASTGDAVRDAAGRVRDFFKDLGA